MQVLSGLEIHFIIETQDIVNLFLQDKHSKKKIVYSGDLRLHGPKADQVRYFIEKAHDFEPDVLIVEGTRIDSQVENELKGEAEVEFEITSFLKHIQHKNPSAPIFFECSRTDLFRFQSFYQAAKQSNRKLVLHPRTYYLLQKSIEGKVKGLERINLEDIGAYFPRKGWMVYDTQDYKRSATIKCLIEKFEEKYEIKATDINSSTNNEELLSEFDPDFWIRAQDISEHPEKYLVYLDLYSMNELCDINPSDDMYYILSKSEWDDPKSRLNEMKKKNWLKLFNFNEKNMFKVHCSGHITPSHLRDMINTIKPKQIFPIHTLSPKKFYNLGLLPEIEIILPKKGETYEI